VCTGFERGNMKVRKMQREKDTETEKGEMGEQKEMEKTLQIT
jgi:hypothetical protein